MKSALIGKQVLVVEPDDVLGDSIQEMLMDDTEVEAVSRCRDIKTALELLSKRAYDFVVMEVILPLTPEAALRSKELEAQRSELRKNDRPQGMSDEQFLDWLGSMDEAAVRLRYQIEILDQERWLQLDADGGLHLIADWLNLLQARGKIKDGKVETGVLFMTTLELDKLREAVSNLGQEWNVKLTTACLSKPVFEEDIVEALEELADRLD